MKKLLILNGLLILLTLVQAISSCSKNGFEDEQKQKKLNTFASKSLMLSLPHEDQKQAWLIRLKMYESLDLSADQKSILEEIIADVAEMETGKFFLSENLRNDAASMAKITPQEDFINLFCEVTATLPVLQKNGPVCADYIIADLKTDVGPVPNSGTQVIYRTENCNCNWTCGQQLDDCGGTGVLQEACSASTSTGCCTPAGGCGLFNMGTCTGRVVCDKD